MTEAPSRTTGGSRRCRTVENRLAVKRSWRWPFESQGARHTPAQSLPPKSRALDGSATRRGGLPAAYDQLRPGRQPQGRAGEISLTSPAHPWVGVPVTLKQPSARPSRDQ